MGDCGKMRNKYFQIILQELVCVYSSLGAVDIVHCELPRISNAGWEWGLPVTPTMKKYCQRLPRASQLAR